MYFLELALDMRQLHTYLCKYFLAKRMYIYQKYFVVCFQRPLISSCNKYIRGIALCCNVHLQRIFQNSISHQKLFVLCCEVSELISSAFVMCTHLQQLEYMTCQFPLLSQFVAKSLMQSDRLRPVEKGGKGWGELPPPPPQIQKQNLLYQTYGYQYSLTLSKVKPS